MAKAPVIYTPGVGDPYPLLKDSGGGVLVPAFATDPCDCCGEGPAPCGDCTSTPATVTVTISGMQSEGVYSCSPCDSIDGVYVLTQDEFNPCSYCYSDPDFSCYSGFITGMTIEANIGTSFMIVYLTVGNAGTCGSTSGWTWRSEEMTNPSDSCVGFSDSSGVLGPVANPTSLTDPYCEATGSATFELDT